MKSALVLGGLLALASPTFAAPGELIPELIPAEARWLAHLDMEALQKSVLFQTVSAREDFREGMEEARAELGVDPLGLVRSISVYSTSAEPETGVALMVVSEEATNFLERLKEEGGYQAIEQGGRLMHSWSDDEGGEGERVFAYVHRFEGVSNRLVFVSNTVAEVLGAVDVLDGNRKSITEVGENRLSARPRPGSILYLETSEDIPGLDQVQQVSAIAALAHGLRFDFGEAGGVFSADLVVTAQNAGEAQKLTNVLQGVTALAGLLSGEHGGPELQTLVNALQFTSNGNQVGVQFLFDSRRLIELVEDLEEMDY